MAGLVTLVSVAGLLCAAGGTTRCPAELNDATPCQGAVQKDDCPKGYLYAEKIIGCSLCPGCVKYREFGQTCQQPESAPARSLYSVSMQEGVAHVMATACGPGLACNDTTSRCDLAAQTTQCLTDLARFKSADPPKPYWYLPECEADGTYAPVQCQGRSASGLCFCVNKKGERIFGRDLPSNEKRMTCACARRFIELQKAGQTDITLHCAPNGNFEPLQCDQEVCFCVNSTTARTYGGAVSRDQWTGLTCYQSSFYPGDYNRQCESMNVASKKVATLLASHGIRESNFTSHCDPDGGYYAVYCNAQDQTCKCRDRAGNNIGSYIVDSSHSEANTMDCRCARDHNDYDAIAYKTRNLKCATTGNYEPEQCGDDQCYCVDGWGSRSSLPVDTNIPGVGAQTRCCLPCLQKDKLDCSDKTVYEPYCPEGLPPDQ